MEHQLIFDPENHPSDTLKAFDEFRSAFEFRYAAQFPDPPRVSMDAAIERWKVGQSTVDIPNPKPTLTQYDQIRDQWIEKDMVAKFIGLFSSQRLQADWQAAETDNEVRKHARWPDFIEKMRTYYQPTENPVLANFHFRSLTQQETETFHGFRNRVEKQSKTCYFTCESPTCNADKIAVRDQVVIGTTSSKIRGEALLNSWELGNLRKEGMKIESAVRGDSEITTPDISATVNKVGKYSYKTLRAKAKPQQPLPEQPPKQFNRQPRTAPKEKSCYNCGNPFKGNPLTHLQSCPAKEVTCSNCGRMGHFFKHCRSKGINQLSKEKDRESEDELWSINLFRIETVNPPILKTADNSKQHDFRAQVAINNSIASVIADTGARVSVCSSKHAKKWGLWNKMLPSKAKIKPYNSPPIPVTGVARCAVTFGNRSTPVVWHIINSSCEPILGGNTAVQLGILKFTKQPDTFIPINLIHAECQPNAKNDLQKILTEYNDTFTTTGIGKLKDYQVIFCEDKNVKPVITPPRPTQYHLEERVNEELQRMTTNDVIEEHPRTEPAPWISAAVIVPKPDGGIRITMDARNVNRAILANNLPIPKQEDIKAKMAGSKVYSKVDLTTSYWQLELAAQSRHLTVFQCNGKLYRYKRMTMGIKTAQGELNAALRPLLQDIEDAHHIHDDIIIASKNMKEHLKAIRQVLNAVKDAGMKLNPKKCEFAKKEISFWGLIVSEDGVKPDPRKVEALEHLEAPRTKEELRSFLCMMQSNAEFIPNFSKISAELRELTRDKVHFKWNNEHQNTFETLLKAFKKNVSLRYFDPTQKIFITTDAHQSGLAATLLQGYSKETAKPVAYASRRTTPPESRYPQMDLEAMAVDFGLRRFRNYILGAPDTITIVTDHKPLLAVFNGNQNGSIRTEKIKARNQDISYNLVYQKGKLNETDFISRHAKPLKLLTTSEKYEADELNAHLYMIHTTPITDRIGLDKIASQTATDPILRELKQIVESGKTWIHKNAHPELLKFSPILHTISTTNSGMLLKEERIILPKSLQEDAVQLAHQGSHVGQSGLQRRLRYHFYFHGMNEMVKKHIEECFDCQLFTDKKCSEPLKQHKVPSRCWETVAVDLFGPLPSKNHVVVIQDLASRFPVAKLVKSTSAQNVLPILGETYDLLGNPENQLSDNGPPFNSKAMQNFANQRSINLQKTPPLHPSANPVETFMKPLGKNMKIAIKNHTPEKVAISNLLESYRDTPHPATGIPPNAMIFRDQQQTQFPRRALSDQEIEEARVRDRMTKTSRTEKINQSKYKQNATIKVGDQVLNRNKRSSKFHPYFSPDEYEVVEILSEGSVVKIRREEDGKLFIRHPDDIRTSITRPPKKPKQVIPAQKSLMDKWRSAVMSGNMNSEDDYHDNSDAESDYRSTS